MLKNIFNFSIAILPILSGYRFVDNIDLGTFVVFVFGFLCLIFNSKQFKLELPKGYSPFFFIAIIFSILFIHSLPLRLCLFSLNLLFACCYVDISKLLNYYSKIVMISCGFFIIQELSYYLTGERIVGILSFLPTIYNFDDSTIFFENIKFSTRAASFFLEPSYFAQLLFPYIVYNLFSKDISKIKNAILVSSVMLFIKSGNGSILLIIIYICWLIFGKVKLKQRLITFFIGFIGLILVLIIDNSLIDTLLSRTSELQSYKGNEKYMSSGFMRMFRGYYIFNDLPLINKIFGAHNDLIEYYRARSMYFLIDGDKFFNGFQSLLLHNGLIVTILYLIHLLKLGNKTSDKRIIAFTICIIYLLFSESYYLSSRLFFVVVMLFGLYQIKTNTGCNKIIKG